MATTAKSAARSKSRKASSPGLRVAASAASLVEESRPEDEELAELAKALAHPVRVLIIRNLLRIGTCYFGKLADLLPVAPSTASQHLSILKDAGLVKGNINEGRGCDAAETRPCYCVDLAKLRRLQHLIGHI